MGMGDQVLFYAEAKWSTGHPLFFPFFFFGKLDIRIYIDKGSSVLSRNPSEASAICACDPFPLPGPPLEEGRVLEGESMLSYE